MKKITTLLSLALCLIVGGVYASWVYTGTTVTSPDTQSFYINIDSKSETGDAGAIIVDSTSALSFKAVNASTDSASDDYYKVRLTHEGNLVFRFTPKNGAPSAYMNGIPMKLTFTVGHVSFSNDTADASDDVVILKIKDQTVTDGRTRIIINTPAVDAATVDTLNASNQLGTYTKVAATETEDLHYIWTISSEQIASILVFCDDNQDLKLDTAKKHDLFTGNLANSGMTFMIEAAVA